MGAQGESEALAAFRGVLVSGSVSVGIRSATFLNPKGYGDGAVSRFCSAGAGSSGSDGAELDDWASPRAIGKSPLCKLRLDRSPARDPVPTAGRRILAGVACRLGFA